MMVMAKPWQEFFDGHAPAYDENVFTKATEVEVRFLVDALQRDPGAAILDVGCGTGRHAIALAQLGYRVTGLDLSPGMLAQARHKAEAAGVAVTWVQGDATTMSFDRCFDAAICLCEGAFGLLNPGDDPIGQPLSILRNIASALRPGGPFVLTVLNALRPVRLYTPEDLSAGRFDPLSMTELSDAPGANTHRPVPLRERSFVPTELRLLLETAGFEVAWMGGGTAGNWGRRPLDLDEYEIMVIAHGSQRASITAAR